MIELQYIILIIYILVLYFVSDYDYRHMLVKLNEGLLLVAIGLSYTILVTGAYIDTLVTLLLMLMVFGVPCLFGFGLGDLLVFISLAPFLAIGDATQYLFVFFLIWVLWHILMVHKNIKEGSLQGYRASFSRQKMFTLQYPLIPAILISFLFWVPFQLLA